MAPPSQTSRLSESRESSPDGDSRYVNTSSGTFEYVRGRIFVGGVPAETTENELRSFFQAVAPVRQVKIMRDHHSNRPRGFGFVTFMSDEEAKNVLEMKLKFKDRFLNLNPAMRRVDPRMSQGAQPPQMYAAQPTYIVQPSVDGAAWYQAEQPRFVMPQMQVHNAPMMPLFGCYTQEPYYVNEMQMDQPFYAGYNFDPHMQQNIIDQHMYYQGHQFPYNNYMVSNEFPHEIVE